MRRIVVLTLLVVAFFHASGRTRGQDLPPPRVMPRIEPGPAAPPPLMYSRPMPYPPPPPYRISAYEVWQYRSVNRQGEWRFRVFDTPYGAYYLWHGVPYPWVNVHTLEYMPYARDSGG